MLFDGTHGKADAAPTGRIVAGLALSGAVLFGTACEPTAFIAQQIHDFQAVYSTGAIGQECNETSAEVRPELRFTLVDTDQNFIFPGDELGPFTLDLGNTFTPDELSIQGNNGVLFPAPDVECEAGAQIGSACPDAGLAAAGFTCQPIDPSAPTGDALARVVCALPDFTIEISPNAEIAFDGDDIQRKAIIVLMANGASLLGLDSSGIPDRLNCSSDPFDRRTRGANLMLRQLADDGNPYVGRTQMCIGTFEGQSEPDYKFPDGQAVANCFQPVADGGAGFNFLDSTINAIGVQEGPGGRNPWAAVIDASARFNDWISTDYERHIVLFTDGDLSEDVVETAAALGQNFDGAVQAALNNEVTLHVIQLDRRDRADDCTTASVHGALEEFSRLACATGGNYTYLERADDLPEFFTNLGRSLPGQYEIPLVAEQLATLPLGPYKLAFTLNANVDDKQGSFIFSALAGTGDSTSGRQDTRMSIINRGDCASRSCLPGYVCDDTSATCHTPAPGSATPSTPEGSGEESGE